MSCKFHIKIIERMMFAFANTTVDGIKIYPTLKAAKEALEKQTPKKKIVEITGKDTKIGVTTLRAGTQLYKCSCCKVPIAPYYKYCNECGQKLFTNL